MVVVTCEQIRAYGAVTLPGAEINKFPPVAYFLSGNFTNK
jgi:hypothetical protein